MRSLLTLVGQVAKEEFNTGQLIDFFIMFIRYGHETMLRIKDLDSNYFLHFLAKLTRVQPNLVQGFDNKFNISHSLFNLMRDTAKAREYIESLEFNFT